MQNFVSLIFIWPWFPAWLIDYAAVRIALLTNLSVGCIILVTSLSLKTAGLKMIMYQNDYIAAFPKRGLDYSTACTAGSDKDLKILQ